MFVPRQPGSLPFLMLLALGDVALVPFPFGGSKTSLDSIAMGIPTVTMPTQHLRGRMTLSYYLSMGLASQCCVASSLATYVLVAGCVLVIVVVTLCGWWTSDAARGFAGMWPWLHSWGKTPGPVLPLPKRCVFDPSWCGSVRRLPCGGSSSSSPPLGA